MFHPTNNRGHRHSHGGQQRQAQQPIVIDLVNSDASEGQDYTPRPQPQLQHQQHPESYSDYLHALQTEIENGDIEADDDEGGVGIGMNLDPDSDPDDADPNRFPPPANDERAMILMLLEQQRLRHQRQQQREAQAQAQAQQIQAQAQRHQFQHHYQQQQQPYQGYLDSEQKLRSRHREDRHSALSVLLDRELLMLQALAMNETLPQARRRFTSKLLAPQDPADAAAIRADRYTVPVPSSSGSAQYVSMPRSVVDIHETGDAGWVRPGSSLDLQSQSQSQSPAASPLGKGWSNRTPQRGRAPTPGSAQRRRSGR